jgi:hypothetical protein
MGGALKIFLMTGTHLGYNAYTSWKFSELLAKHVTQKLATNEGLLRISQDF